MFHITALTIGVVIFSGAIGVGGFLAMGGKMPGARECAGGMVGASIGGPFELTDHTGARVSSADLKGEPALVYFGYGTCPDVCPAELGNVAAATEILDERGITVRPIFITVDPERDTTEVLSEYVPFFHERMVGLTGTPAEIDAAAKAYRIYYTRVADPDFPDGYSMDHSSYVFLMDDEMNYVTFYKYGDTPEQIADGVACHLG